MAGQPTPSQFSQSLQKSYTHARRPYQLASRISTLAASHAFSAERLTRS